ncbi:hypothetical protein LIER_28596 [Lithospermum erythrorhizon]|uniref:Uncharacterized protein n=1 Tax=Lithospermum erythrorhizon TaxID=34254 RepID=A0AAV3RG89_LITER
MAMVMYMIDTGASFNLGQFVFDQVVQHVQLHAILKPIAYPIETGGGSSVGNDETARFLRDEIKHLEGVIQSSLARKSILEARLRSLTGDLVVDPGASNSEAEASQE